MSLSRHFKSSDSFQPKEIVRDESPDAAGWHSTQAAVPTQPFQNQKITESHLAADKTQQATPSEPPPEAPLKPPAEVPAELPNQPHNSIPPAQESIQPPTSPGPPAPAVDLSHYIEITVAEERQQEAYQAGLAEGAKKIEQDFGSAAKSLLIACQQLDTIRETLITNSVVEIQDFILAIAEKIIRTSVAEQDVTVIATVEEALQRAVKSDEFYIYIHPDDYEVVAAKSDNFVAGVSGLQNVVIKKDATIERGGVKIESENCTIDATISSQFEMIRDAVKKNF